MKPACSRTNLAARLRLFDRRDETDAEEEEEIVDGLVVKKRRRIDFLVLRGRSVGGSISKSRARRLPFSTARFSAGYSSTPITACFSRASLAGERMGGALSLSLPRLSLVSDRLEWLA